MNQSIFPTHIRFMNRLNGKFTVENLLPKEAHLIKGPLNHLVSTATLDSSQNSLPLSFFSIEAVLWLLSLSTVFSERETVEPTCPVFQSLCFPLFQPPRRWWKAQIWRRWRAQNRNPRFTQINPSVLPRGERSRRRFSRVYSVRCRVGVLASRMEKMEGSWAKTPAEAPSGYGSDALSDLY